MPLNYYLVYKMEEGITAKYYNQVEIKHNSRDSVNKLDYNSSARFFKTTHKPTTRETPTTKQMLE